MMKKLFLLLASMTFFLVGYDYTSADKITKGNYTFESPAGWSQESHGHYVYFLSPDHDADIYVLVVKKNNVEKAIDEWEAELKDEYKEIKEPKEDTGHEYEVSGMKALMFSTTAQYKDGSWGVFDIDILHNEATGEYIIISTFVDNKSTHKDDYLKVADKLITTIKVKH